MYEMRRKKREKRKGARFVFLSSFFFSFFFLLQSSLLSLSPSLFLLTLVFRKEHVRDPLFDRKLPPGLRAHQRSLDEAKLEQRVVERFQKASSLRSFSVGGSRCRGGSQPREAAASARAPNSRRGSMSRRKSGSKSASMVSTCEKGKRWKRGKSRLRKKRKGTRRRLSLFSFAFEFLKLFFLLSSHLGRLDLEREVVGDTLDVAREHVVCEELHGVSEKETGGKNREEKQSNRRPIFFLRRFFCEN